VVSINLVNIKYIKLSRLNPNLKKVQKIPKKSTPKSVMKGGGNRCKCFLNRGLGGRCGSIAVAGSDYCSFILIARGNKLFLFNINSLLIPITVES